MPAVLSDNVDRLLSEVVRGRVDDEPVVVLQGARAVGKSTLLQALAASHGRQVIDFDDLALLADPRLPTTAREEYITRLTTGGFPPALRQSTHQARARWFDDYVKLVIERDVLELTRVRQRRQLPLLLRQLASQTGHVLNVAKAAAAIGMEKSTAENYARLLEAAFLRP